MEVLQRLLSGQGRACPPPHGPRSQGETDVLVEEDIRNIDSLPPMRLAYLDEDSMRARGSTQETIVVATFHDREILVYDDGRIEEFVQDWIDKLKADFQGMRLLNKRTWPEFLDALYSGQYAQTDCDILYYLRDIPVVTASGDAPRGVTDSDLKTQVVRGLKVTTLGACCEIRHYDVDDRESVLEAARALYLDCSCPGDVLVSKLVTRMKEAKTTAKETKTTVKEAKTKEATATATAEA